MPIRGHSGVQGGAEVGCMPVVDAEDARPVVRAVGLHVPDEPGLAADG